MPFSRHTLWPVIIALCMSPAVGATGDDINAVFGSFGFSEKAEIKSNSCVVRLDIDRSKFLSAVPKLQQLGLLNAEMSRAYINSHPNSLAMTFAFSMATTVIPDFFEVNPRDDGCDFIQTITVPDDYGNDETKLAFRYEFNRKLNERVNWKNFQFTRLPKIAPNFRMGPEMLVLMRQENSSDD